MGFSSPTATHLLQIKELAVLAFEGDPDGSLYFWHHRDMFTVQKIISNVVHIMQINARATYGLSFGGSSPHIFLPDRYGSSTAESFSTRKDSSNGLLPNNTEWTLYLPKAYHPLLLQSHRENSQKANVSHASSLFPLIFPFIWVWRGERLLVLGWALCFVKWADVKPIE